MSNNNSMVTSLNDIPHNTNNNNINSDELNDPTIKELFKDYEIKAKKPKKDNNNQINDIEEQDYNIDENVIRQQQEHEMMMQQHENEMMMQQQEQEIMMQQQEMMNQQHQIQGNQKIYNNDFEKEMDNFMDNNTLNLDNNLSNNNTSDNNSSNNNELFTKQNMIKIGIILLVFIIITNLNIIRFLEKYIPPNIYNILSMYDKYLNYIISIIILYILYFFKYL